MSSASTGPRLAGKVAIVTGAGRGIGRAEARLFAAQGARVVVNDLPGREGQPGAADAVVAEIRAAGGDAIAVHRSVSDWASGPALVQAAIDHYGRLDILSNNAGVIHPGRIDTLDEEGLDRVLAVNIRGYFATARHAAPHFIAQKSGVVISKGSPAAYGQYGMSAYAATKGAVVAFTRSIARDLGEFGVRANVVIPVSFDTAMGTPEVVKMGAYGRARYQNLGIWNRPLLPTGNVHPMPEHVAAMTVWLCTDAAANVNGRELYIAGAEAGLMPEPELQRACFAPAGWTLDDFDQPAHRAYLVGQVRNWFT